jgi:hypothetical protein
MILDKKSCLFERDEKGELLPQKVTLRMEGSPEMLVTPLTRGEIQRIYESAKKESKDQDLDIIVNHCIEPNFTLEEAKIIKVKLAGAIINSIMALSLDMDLEDFEKLSTKTAVEQSEIFLKKN